MDKKAPEHALILGNARAFLKEHGKIQGRSEIALASAVDMVK